MCRATRSELKAMLSACDPPLSDDDHGGTVRYQSTQVHPEPEGSIQLLPPKGAEARQRAFEELTRLTEAFVSTLERELTKESSLRGVSTIDDVGSESAAELAPAKRTLQPGAHRLSNCHARRYRRIICAAGSSPTS